jgi:glycosyltransferase involved in cell wall biosynthesis
MKISILTPAFNAGAYLERAIQSVLAQDDTDFEHIVVDGGSKDGTVVILKKYPHLKWVSEPDRGQCDAMNKAFSLSSGEIVTYLNADDWFERGVFAHIRDCFGRQLGTDMVIGNFYIRYAGKTAVRLVVPVKDYLSTLQFFRYDWPLNPVCYFYRRRVQEAIGTFPVDMHLGMDYWFLIRAMAKARIHPSELVFGTYFFPPDSKTSLTSSIADLEEGQRRFRTWVTQHLRENQSYLIPWFHAQWFFHHWVRRFPEKAKRPIRLLAYKVFFSGMLGYGEYQALGFRRAYRKRFPRH